MMYVCMIKEYIAGRNNNLKWFEEYDKKHYSLENKLIQLNRTPISKLDKNEWKNDYIIHEIVEKYEN